LLTNYGEPADRAPQRAREAVEYWRPSATPSPSS
jgi:hypothetical protein